MTTATADPGLPAAAPAPRAGLASWLGVLLISLCCLNAAGGWVRLSGAGVAIPNWPLIEIDGGRRTLLPPMDDAAWSAAHATWIAHQEILARKVSAGEIHGQAVGRQPADAGEFKAMFLTEWTHRLIAALVGLLALACLGTALIDPGLRRKVGAPVGAAVALIAVQAVLGAALIGQGTSTRWLFLHQGNAALILGLVLVAILRLLSAGEAMAAPAHRSVVRLAAAAMVLTWIELMVGGLLAASRHHLPPGGLLGVDAGPLWWPVESVATNILDNAAVHHVAHRIVALAAAATVLAALIAAHRRGAPERARLALGVAASFVALQAVMGMASTLMPRGEVALPLAHLFLGHAMFLVLVLAWRDARHPVQSAVAGGVAA